MSSDLRQLRGQVEKALTQLREVLDTLEHRPQEAAYGVRWLSTIHAISGKISRAADPNAVLGEVLDTVLPLIAMDLGAIHVGDPQGPGLLLTAYRGVPPEQAREMSLARRGEGQVGKVAETGESRSLSGLSQLTGPLVAVAQKAGMKCLALVPLKAQDTTLGVLSVGSLKKEQVSPDEMLLLESLGVQIGVALAGARRFQEAERERAVAQALARSLEEDKGRLQQAYLGVAALVADTLVQRHAYLRGHPGRVANFATRIARQMGLSPEQVATISAACALFDLGLIAIPDEGVRQLDPLVLEKGEDIKRHPVIAEEMVRRLGFLEGTLTLVRHHHERVDGQGYPDGLVGETIPLEARVIAVADTWDRLTMDWPHRSGLDRDTAVVLLRQRAGVHYDTKVVEAFLVTLKSP